MSVVIDAVLILLGSVAATIALAAFIVGAVEAILWIERRV